MLIWWLLTLSALADPYAELAPGPVELSASLVELEARLAAADASATALARTHNRLAERLARSGRAEICEDSVAVSLAARSLPLGAYHRDRVQAARAEAARVERLTASPTLAALVSEVEAERVQALIQRTEVLSLGYAEQSAWEAAHGAPVRRRCGSALTTAEGLAAPSTSPTIAAKIDFDPALATGSAPPAGDASEQVILAFGGGLVCPSGRPASGQAMPVVGPACYSEAPCACEPVAVAPAAVLGPGSAQ